MSAVSTRKYRVLLYTWQCHAINVKAESAEAAKELALTSYEDFCLDEFTFRDEGVDEFYCEEA